MNESKVFIAYGDNSANNYYLHGIVCTISETNITVGADTVLREAFYAGNIISAVALNENKIFIAHSAGSNYYLYSLVCTINGTTITAGTDTQLNSTVNSGSAISAVKLDEGKVFIAHSYGTNYHLYGIVCTISGTTITKGTDTAIEISTNRGYVISAIALSENKVNIIHRDSNNHLYSMLCDISETTIAKGNDTQLSSAENSGSTISATALDENNIFVGHSSGTNNYLYGMVLGYLANLAKAVKTKNEVINGVAISSAQDGETVQVKVPGEE